MFEEKLQAMLISHSLVCIYFRYLYVTGKKKFVFPYEPPVFPDVTIIYASDLRLSMSKRMAVLSSLLFATILLSPLASADVTEETIYFSSITSYELEDIVISGYVEPNVETIGRVCYQTAVRVTKIVMTSGI